jgi:hypothetical protein
MEWLQVFVCHMPLGRRAPRFASSNFLPLTSYFEIATRYNNLAPTDLQLDNSLDITSGLTNSHSETAHNVPYNSR